MYGTYTSSKYVEIISGDNYVETRFDITLCCSARSDKGQYSGPPENCYPAEAAEFELENIQVVDDDGNSTSLLEDTFIKIVGRDMAKSLIEDAEQEAMETGEF